MKKHFFPKIIFPAIYLFFISFLVFFLIKSIGVIKEKSIDTNIIFSGIIFLLFIGYFTFHLIYFFSFYFKYALVKENTILIFELKRLTTTKIHFSEIKGYSKSEVFFGLHSSWKNSSIIVYSNSNQTFEFVNCFIFNLNDLEKELKRQKVKYLGKESYKTGWFFRKYDF